MTFLSCILIKDRGAYGRRGHSLVSAQLKIQLNYCAPQFVIVVHCISLGLICNFFPLMMLHFVWCTSKQSQLFFSRFTFFQDPLPQSCSCALDFIGCLAAGPPRNNTWRSNALQLSRILSAINSYFGNEPSSSLKTKLCLLYPQC